jgi:predicted XRE-type DNA-binding protein
MREIVARKLGVPKALSTGNLAEAITLGGHNVLADLNLPDAEERQTKLRLAVAINDVVASKRLNQTQAAERLGVNQPKISALTHYKLDGSSVERLMTFLTALDRDVEITIRKKPRSRGAGRVVVVAA